MMGRHLLLLLSHPRSPSIVPYGTLDHLESHREQYLDLSFPWYTSITCYQEFPLLVGCHNLIVKYHISLVVKTEFFPSETVQKIHKKSTIQALPFLNNPKDLDLSDQTDLDLWDCLGRVKLVLWQTFVALI